jgi:hypothetical protein
MDTAVKMRAETNTSARTEKKTAVIKSLYAVLSPLTKSGVTPGGGGDAGTKPPSVELMTRKSEGPDTARAAAATSFPEHSPRRSGGADDY